MNQIKNKLVYLLNNLKSNYSVSGVKAEFEAEGTRLDEAIKLKELVSKANLEFAIKIGGCEAIKEMYEAKSIGVDSLVAPMIETPYALKKYANAIKKIFFNNDNVSFYINIETITGFNNLNDIINSSDFDIISGIILGRDDMTGSMGLTNQFVESQEIYRITNIIAEKMNALDKHFIVGGSISNESIKTFKNLQPHSITKFETRKIIFDSNAIDIDNINEGLINAIEFEILWLKNKRENYKIILDEDTQRLNILEKRYNNMLHESGRFYAQI